jgi:hypothetical protein
MNGVAGHAEAQDACQKMEAELKRLKAELESMNREQAVPDRSEPAGASDGLAKKQEKQKEVSVVEQRLQEARKKLAELGETQLAGDKELAGIRASLQSTFGQIAGRVKSDAELESLKAKEATLIARRRELISQQRKAAGLPGGATNRMATVPPSNG